MGLKNDGFNPLDGYLRKFGIVSVVLLLVLAGTGGAIYLTTANEIEQDTENQVVLSSSAQAQQLAQLSHNIEHETRLITLTEPVQSGDSEQINQFLQEDISSQVVDETIGVHYVDTSGSDPVITASSNQEFVGANPREQGAPWAQGEIGFESDSEVRVSQPFSVDFTNDTALAYYTSVPNQDAVMVMMVSADEISESLSPPAGGNSYVVNQQGIIVLSSKADHIGKSIRNHSVITQRRVNDVLSRNMGSMDGHHSGEDHQHSQNVTAEYYEIEHHNVTRSAGVAHVPGTSWVAIGQVKKSTAFSLKGTIATNIAFGGAIVLFGFGLLGLVVGRNIRRIEDLTEKAQAVAGGQFDVDITPKGSDEVHDLYVAIGTMRDSLQSRVQEAESTRDEIESLNSDLQVAVDEVEEALDAAAGGDLTVRADIDTEFDEINELTGSFNAMIETIQDSVREAKVFGYEVAGASREVAAGNEEVYEASQRVADATQQISDGASEQNEMLAGTADEMNNLSATIEEVASSADDLADRSSRAAELSRSGREDTEDAVDALQTIETQTERAVDTVEALNEEMDNISEVVDFISEVAEQTNMLAINARVEAARAGEAGEGFAVVADEVKDLADETAQAAEDIEESLSSLKEQTETTVDDMEEAQREVSTGAETIEDALDSLDEIAEVVEDVNAGIQEIDEAAERQSESAQEVVQQVDDVANISEETSAQAQNVAAASEEQSASTQQVRDSVTMLKNGAERLQEHLSEFNVGVDEEELEDKAADVDIQVEVPDEMYGEEDAEDMDFDVKDMDFDVDEDDE